MGQAGGGGLRVGDGHAKVDGWVGWTGSGGIGGIGGGVSGGQRFGARAAADALAGQAGQDMGRVDALQLHLGVQGLGGHGPLALGVELAAGGAWICLRCAGGLFCLLGYFRAMGQLQLELVERPHLAIELRLGLQLLQGQGGGIPGAGLGVGEVGAKAPNAVGIGGDVQLPGEIAGRQLRGKEGEIDVLQLQLGLRQRLGLPWGDGGVQAGG